MIVVGFERELREAFAAGQAACAARYLSHQKHAAQYFKNVPKTYEEWIESISNRPAVVRG